MSADSLASRARLLVFALVVVGLASVVPAAAAHADAVGMLDPELAEICGGSAHSPSCRTEPVGMACCAGGFLLVAGLGVVGVALASREEKQ